MRAAALAVLVLSPTLFASVAAAQAPAPPAAPECFPACRDGFVCHQGQCVSACNPPCPTGEICTASGQCVPAMPPQAAPTPYPAWGLPSEPMRLDPGWASGAATFGYVSAGVIIALTIGVLANNDPETADAARTIGGVAVAYLAVAAPVVATGGGSARTHPAVTGAPGLRLTSWIGYGVALLDAVVLLALSFDNEIEDAHILSVGVLGSLCTLGFAMDARISVQQVEALRAGSGPRPPGAAGPRWQPTPSFRLARTPEGQATPLIGFALRF